MGGRAVLCNIRVDSAAVPGGGLSTSIVDTRSGIIVSSSDVSSISLTKQ